jgi:hypothetical protein
MSSRNNTEIQHTGPEALNKLYLSDIINVNGEKHTIKMISELIGFHSYTYTEREAVVERYLDA